VAQGKLSGSAVFVIDPWAADVFEIDGSAEILAPHPRVCGLGFQGAKSKRAKKPRTAVPNRKGKGKKGK
jgi:hypothetical protein